MKMLEYFNVKYKRLINDLKDTDDQNEMIFITSAQASSTDFRQIESELSTNIELGLNTDEVKHRRKLYGANEFDVGEGEPLWRKYLNQVRSLCMVDRSHLLSSSTNNKQKQPPHVFYKTRCS